MSADDKYNKKTGLTGLNGSDQDTEGESGKGSGGKSGQIEFRDFLASGEHLRDDLLSSDEIRRLLSVHKDGHEDRVKLQKDKREQYKALKEGKISLAAHRQGLMGAGMSAQYKVNPILANKAQFSGVDRQINPIPEENIAETNNEKRNELQFQYNLRHRPEYAHAPKFIPPKLTR
ncbi:hypothetical protein [Aquicella lusitana]|uniref:Uncharacterized protein n=1 Tax=Aquicella lusitana TaxID=254246 RepID=A0A370GJC2_9COXI|nr:hypothetical protein [Aquicella lusitana]RDI43761.1 hypothetical protein C8D86_11031 [Aquicella lusitana]VVC74508.1 hypothetical protein AQULUS_22740 [Aquicella lusitana]